MSHFVGEAAGKLYEVLMQVLHTFVTHSKLLILSTGISLTKPATQRYN
jgi:hypothetical protein